MHSHFNTAKPGRFSLIEIHGLSNTLGSFLPTDVRLLTNHCRYDANG